MISRLRGRRARIAVGSAVVAGVAAVTCGAAGVFSASAAPDNSLVTTTPIKHVVVLFSENVSFDHYFATYPNAANTDGTTFIAASNTPTNIDTEANATSSGTSAGSKGYLLTTANPDAASVGGAAPARLTHAQALTTSQGHSYLPEQQAMDWDAAANNGNGGAKMDDFISTQSGTTAPVNATSSASGYTFSSPSIVQDYYDGNTVTGLWNYAQNYAMSDNSWDAGFGPSTVGALNLISGQTGHSTAYTSDNTRDSSTGKRSLTKTSNGATAISSINTTTDVGTTTGDPTPAYDDCSDGSTYAGQAGKNVGDLLNSKNVSWGWFQGGFAPSTAATNSTLAVCGSTTPGLDGEVGAYSPHHNPFEYYASTANPKHTAPASLAEVGHDGQANHEYDLSYFDEALDAGNLPAVSFLKAPRAQDGHPGNSDPLDEQAFFTSEINTIEQSKYWPSTAIVIAYDDSDGWYDHVAPIITNSSNDDGSAKNGHSASTEHDGAICTSAAAAGVPAIGDIADRCGPSQRLPLLVISPYSKQNYVSHDLTSQVSVLQFIEDNWSTGKIGAGSLDADTSTDNLADMLNFAAPQQNNLVLNADGSVQSKNTVKIQSASVVSLAASKTSQVYGSAATSKLTATVKGEVGPPSGKVEFYDNGTEVGTATVAAGKASYTLSRTLSAGKHSFYSVFAPSSSTVAPAKSTIVTVTVAQAASKSALKTAATSVKKGKKDSLTDAVTAAGAVPTGSVSLYDGHKKISSASLHSGRATFSISLARGKHSLVAKYAGGTNLEPSNSNKVTITVK